MGEGYNPPFTMNEEITNLIVEIGEYVTRPAHIKILKMVSYLLWKMVLELV